MTRSAGDSPGARALRAAGYVKLPGFWVTEEQYELVAYMARQNKDTIDTIKERANAKNQQGYYTRYDEDGA